MRGARVPAAALAKRETIKARQTRQPRQGTMTGISNCPFASVFRSLSTINAVFIRPKTRSKRRLVAEASSEISPENARIETIQGRMATILAWPFHKRGASP